MRIDPQHMGRPATTVGRNIVRLHWNSPVRYRKVLFVSPCFVAASFLGDTWMRIPNWMLPFLWNGLLKIVSLIGRECDGPWTKHSQLLPRGNEVDKIRETQKGAINARQLKFIQARRAWLLGVHFCTTHGRIETETKVWYVSPWNCQRCCNHRILAEIRKNEHGGSGPNERNSP